MRWHLWKTKAERVAEAIAVAKQMMSLQPSEPPVTVSADVSPQAILERNQKLEDKVRGEARQIVEWLLA